jgi:hypothetical protein
MRMDEHDKEEDEHDKGRKMSMGGSVHLAGRAQLKITDVRTNNIVLNTKLMRVVVVVVVL